MAFAFASTHLFESSAKEAEPEVIVVVIMSTKIVGKNCCIDSLVFTPWIGGKWQSV